jgi:hypothetical protein
MTRLFIALSFLVTFSTLTAQEDFNGMWGGDDSSYLTTIIASEYKVLKVFNTSFEETRIVNEEIVKQKGDKFTTELNNELNGYSVKIEYSLKNKDNYIAKNRNNSCFTNITGEPQKQWQQSFRLCQKVPSVRSSADWQSKLLWRLWQ